MANNILGGINRSRVMAELTRRTRGSVVSDSLKKGAVLVPFLISADERSPEVLFTVRSRMLRQHRGQVRYVVSSCTVSISSCLCCIYHLLLLIVIF